MCLGTTGDLVIDLVFEEPSEEAATHANAEIPDNAAEHLLMPSQRVGSSTAYVSAAAPAADLDTLSIALPVTDNAALRTASSQHQLPPTSPLSFSVPLRI